jgi:hypothetical protein
VAEQVTSKYARYASADAPARYQGQQYARRDGYVSDTEYVGANRPVTYALDYRRDVARYAGPDDPVAAPRSESAYANLSAATHTLPGIHRLHVAASAGDEQAAHLLRGVARDSLAHLTGGIPSARVHFHDLTGVYGGEREPSLGVHMEFGHEHRRPALAALARFAGNFNQEQVHVRGPTQPGTGVGHEYGDGSYNTLSYKIPLRGPLSQATIEDVIKKSGLYGLSAGPHHLEAYYVGNPRDARALEEFKSGVNRAVASLGENAQGVSPVLDRFWSYGHGPGTVPYSHIQGDVLTAPAADNPTARRIATRLAGREVAGAPAARAMTPDQAETHRRIALAYDDSQPFHQ